MLIWQKTSELSDLDGRKYRCKSIKRPEKSSWKSKIFVVLSCSVTTPPEPQETEWYWILEPVATHIRTTCKKLLHLGTHIAIDEAMIAYSGRTKHTIKIKNKPISEGYKVWVLAEAGYVWTWLWHSKIEGPERVPKNGTEFNYLPIPYEPVHLAATFALILRLTRELQSWYDNRVFTVFLDNLFLNVDVAQALLVMGFLCMGTTRKNAKGIPKQLLELKDHNRALVWNSCIGIIVNSVLCFLWQDNNAVLGITTAYSLHVLIKCLRTRPSTTSTNAHIVLPVFGDSKKKELEITYAIDEYNHHMNGVDRNNQLRKGMSVRPLQQRTWRPAWLWMLDTVLVNCYLVWKSTKRPIPSRKGHRAFRQALCEALLTWPMKTSDTMRPVLIVEAQKAHVGVRFKTSNYCVICTAKVSKPRGGRQRQFGTDITNEAAGGRRKRGTRTFRGCGKCNKHLCIKKECWEEWHGRNR